MMIDMIRPVFGKKRMKVFRARKDNEHVRIVYIIFMTGDRSNLSIMGRYYFKINGNVNEEDFYKMKDIIRY